MANNIHQLKILLFYPITAHVTANQSGWTMSKLSDSFEILKLPNGQSRNGLDPENAPNNIITPYTGTHIYLIKIVFDM